MPTATTIARRSAQRDHIEDAITSLTDEQYDRYYALREKGVSAYTALERIGALS